MLNSQETVEVGQVRGSASGRTPMTRAGWPGTIPTTTAPFSPAPYRSTLNGASIYIEAKTQARFIQDRGRHAAQGRHPSRDIAQGAGRPVQLSRAVLEHADGLFEEPEGGEGIPALDHLEADLSRSGSTSQQGYSVGATTDWEKSHGLGGGPGHAALHGSPRAAAASPAMPGRPDAMRPRRSPSTSSSICTRRRSRACRPRSRSSGRMSELVKIYG